MFQDFFNVPIQHLISFILLMEEIPRPTTWDGFSYPVNTTNLKWFTGFLPSLNSGRGYFSAVASGAAWLSGAAKPVVKALRKSLGEHGELHLKKRYLSASNPVLNSTRILKWMSDGMNCITPKFLNLDPIYFSREPLHVPLQLHGSDRYGTNLGTALQLAQFRDDAPSQAYFRIPQVFPCFFL